MKIHLYIQLTVCQSETHTGFVCGEYVLLCAHTYTHSPAQSHLCHVLGANWWVQQFRKLLHCCLTDNTTHKDWLRSRLLSQAVQNICSLAYEHDFYRLNTLSASILSALIHMLNHVLSFCWYFPACSAKLASFSLRHRLSWRGWIKYETRSCSVFQQTHPKSRSVGNILYKNELGNNADHSATVTPTKSTL